MSEKHKHRHEHPTYGWWLVLALVGLDYFSTLAYLPSIAVEASGRRAPLAALGVVVVTLLMALPIYFYIAGRSTRGHGATGLLERHVHGWGGKLLMLILLGFVATDFVITRTLSVADASIHILHNPTWKQQVGWTEQHREQMRSWLPEVLQGGFFDFWSEQIIVAVVLSIASFGLYHFVVRGFTRGFMYVAALVVVVFLALTGVVVGSGLAHLARHSDQLAGWIETVRRTSPEPGENPGALFTTMILVALITLPQMALGLSGFELSMTSVPLVRGHQGQDSDHNRKRIRGSRALIVSAALLMTPLLLGAVLVVTLLLPAGAAEYRTLSYLAHGGPLADGQSGTLLNPWFGPVFGTLYDLSTILILFLAGASVTISLRDLVPPYLMRYGMEMRWAHRVGVMMHLFNVVILVVTLWFRASVSAQLWAYATSVLVLLTSAALAAFLDVRVRWSTSRHRWLAQLPFFFFSAFFLAMVIHLLATNRSGLYVALIFVGVVVVMGLVSRWHRSTELRFHGFAFADPVSQERWEEIRRLDFQVLVPHRPEHGTLAEKEKEIRERHRLRPEVPILFVEAVLGDTSAFFQVPFMEIRKENGQEVIVVSRCVSVSHVLAAIALEFRHVGRPPELHFDWSEESPLAANLSFLLFGEGNIPWMVHALIQKAERDPTRRPRVVVG